MEYEPEERRPLIRTISEDGVFDSPQTPVYYEISSKKRRVACFIILLTEMLERLAYYGITSNLILFLNLEPYNWLSYNAMHVFFAFTSVSYIFSVIGGLIADTYLGRFKTIFISLVIYVIGGVFFVLMGYATLDQDFMCDFCDEHDVVNASRTDPTGHKIEPAPAKSPVTCLGPLLVATLLTAIGGGSVRANLSPFGAEQVKHEGPDMIRTFFNWFYWSINIGSCIAFGAVAFVQQNISFFYGYIIVCVAVVLSLMVFTCGRCMFLTKEPTGSVLPNTFKIITQAFRRRKMRKELSITRTSHMLSSCPKVTFLDMAKKRYGGSFHDSMVEDVKSLKKVIGVFLVLVPYWMVYFQMQSTFVLQGLHMRFMIPKHNSTEPSPFNFPVAWLSLFDVVVVILLLPILDRCIYPRLIRRGYNISLFYRILFGMIFSMLSVLTAGGLELARKHCVNDVPNCTLNETMPNTQDSYNAADMWIFYQIPQYILIGISEVLASVAGLEFAYSHAPKSMQGLIMGLFCLSNGIGSLCGSALVALLSIPKIGWFNPEDRGNINDGDLAYYFFMLAGIQLIATVIFFIYNHGKVLNSHPGQQSGPNSLKSSARTIHVQRKNSTSGSGE
ncbi:solute carrier family 15 member 4-like [Lytechinus pictus]|uniref:solute carrier family 15 member 4-like n=1 Tax=Lytechinus pictus TaxID=7653 RepID=UPI0030B9AF77